MTESADEETQSRSLAIRDEMLEALSDAAFEAVILHRDGVIRSANRAAHELVAVEPGTLIGQALMDYIPPDWPSATVRTSTPSRSSGVDPEHQPRLDPLAVCEGDS